VIRDLINTGIVVPLGCTLDQKGATLFFAQILHK
jgi:hypothetical protein